MSPEWLCSILSALFDCVLSLSRVALQLGRDAIIPPSPPTFQLGVQDLSLFTVLPLTLHVSRVALQLGRHAIIPHPLLFSLECRICRYLRCFRSLCMSPEWLCSRFLLFSLEYRICRYLRCSRSLCMSPEWLRSSSQITPEL